MAVDKAVVVGGFAPRAPRVEEYARRRGICVCAPPRAEKYASRRISLDKTSPALGGEILVVGYQTRLSLVSV